MAGGGWSTSVPTQISASRVISKDGAIDAVLRRLAPGWTDSAAGGQDRPDARITAVRRFPAVAAEYAPFPAGLEPALLTALRSHGITEAYSHQAEAIGHAISGRHVVVVTPTASGKTLCYNVPVLNRVLQDSSSRALYLFPTKALAQDQLAELTSMCDALTAAAASRIGVFTYDGDTPQDARRTIRQRAHLVLSNPDMMHSGILPHHPRWAKLLENLRYVILDELHAYRGVFGSHLCNVLRRLRRLCRHYGSDPVFLCSSATIANPRELAERLTERRFELVEKSGAPRGEKLFVFVNPPVVNQQLGIRRSYLSEARRTAGEFLKRHLQLIVFAQSRLATEILTTYLKDDFETEPGASSTIRGYRGGYLPERRREIERGLRQGSVRAVVSTNALELGIDIGALDACVMAGYPGTIAATWQRAGRAGRRAGRSAAVLVASSAPLDQFVVRNPAYFFDASPERALIDPDNLHILVDHIKCAAFELPFSSDEQFGRHDTQEVLSALAEQGLVHRTLGAGPDGDATGEGEPSSESFWTWTSESYPADAVSLRSVSSDNFVVIDITGTPKVIGETDFSSGPSTLHGKAIYIVEGRLYQVEQLDFEGRKAFVRSIDCDYYTTAITYARVTILDTFETGDPWDSDAAGPPRPDEQMSLRAHGEVHVVSRVVGFKKIKFYTNENVGSGDLDLPEQQMHTTAFWLTIPARVMARLPYAADDRRDGIVGLAYAVRQVAQLLLMCDGRDIGLSIDTGEQIDPAAGSHRVTSRLGGMGFPAAIGAWSSTSTAAPVEADEPQEMHLRTTGHGGEYPSPAGGVPGQRATPDDRTPRVFIYDNYPGGIGFSEPLYRLCGELIEGATRLIAQCECEHGCPGCVGPAGNTGPHAKAVALRILTALAAHRETSGAPAAPGSGAVE